MGIGYPGSRNREVLKQSRRVRQRLRIQPSMFIGKSQIKLNDVLHNYEGEVDIEGKACGEGVAIDVEDHGHKTTGTFFNNERHGFCKWTI